MVRGLKGTGKQRHLLRSTLSLLNYVVWRNFSHRSFATLTSWQDGKGSMSVIVLIRHCFQGSSYGGL